MESQINSIPLLCMQAVIEREALLSKKEQELLVSQEKVANKTSVSYFVEHALWFSILFLFYGKFILFNA